MRGVIFKALCDLSSRRLQSFSILLLTTISALLIGISTLTLIGADAPFQRLFTRLHGADVWVYSPSTNTMGQVVDSIYQIDSTAEVSSVWSAISSGSIYDGLKEHIVVVGLPTSSSEIGQLLITSGTNLDSATPDGVVVDQPLAHREHLAVGQTLSIVTFAGVQTLPIIGISIDVNHATNDNNSPWVYLSMPTFQKLFSSSTNQYHLIGIHLNDPQQLNSFENSLTHRLTTLQISYNIIDWRMIKDSYTGFFKLAMIILLSFGVVTLLVSGFLIVNLITGLIIAQTRDIGILKAVGFTPGQIGCLYVLQYSLITMVGAIIGLLLSVSISPYILQQVANALNTIPVPAVNIVLLLSIMAGMIGLVAFFALIPSLRAARIKPVLAITGLYQTGGKLSRLGDFAARFGLPVAWVIGLGQSFAHRGRAALVMSSFAAAIIASITASSIFSTIDTYSTPAAQGIYSTVLVAPSLYGSDATHTLLSTQPDVTSFYTIISQRYHFSGATLFLQYLRGNTQPIRSHLTQGRWFSDYGNEIVMPLSTLNSLKLHLGQTITINGTPSLTVQIVGVYDALYTGAPALASQSLLPNITNTQLDSITYAVTLTSHTNQSEWIQSMLKASDDRINITIQDPNPPAAILSVKAALLLPALILAVVATLSVLNSMFLTIHERSREIGILKSLGMTPGEIFRTIQTSAILYAVFACIVGIPLGIIFTSQLFQGIASSEGFGNIETTINFPWLFLSIPTLIVLALIGVIPPGRSAAWSPTVESLRTE